MTFPLNISVAILVGGLGTRLQSVVNDRPKVMALINGRPFLTYILDKINYAGLKEVVLCVGYMGKYIESEMGTSYGNLSLRYSYEYEPLGTGGALRNASHFLKSDTILVMNGDSYCEYDLQKFWSFHEQNKALASILLTFISSTLRYGRVVIDESNYVLTFEEKGLPSGPGWINAGIYLLSKDIIASIARDRFVSLEREVLPSLIGKEFYGFMDRGNFIDIGTPEDFAATGLFFKKL